MPVVPIVLALAATGFTVALLSSAAQASPAPKARYVKGVRISPEIVALARKWASARKLPLQWVLATIAIESRGNTRAVGDYHRHPDGASIGLMQVNSVAHAQRLAAAGVTRDKLFDPDTNIEWGTLILKEAYNDVQKALKEKPSNVPLDVLVRLRYKGVNTPNSIRAGRDPRTSYPAETVAWAEALAQTRALV